MSSFQRGIQGGPYPAGVVAAPQLPRAPPQLLGAMVARQLPHQVPLPLLGETQPLPRRAQPQLQAGIQQLLLQALQQLLAGAQQPPQPQLLQRLEEGQQLPRPLQQLLLGETLRPLHQALLQQAGDYWAKLTSEPVQLLWCSNTIWVTAAFVSCKAQSSLLPHMGDLCLSHKVEVKASQWDWACLLIELQRMQHSG